MKIGIDCRLWSETGVGRYTRNLVENLLRIDTKNEYVLFVLSKDHDQITSQLSPLTFQLKTADIRWHSVEEQIKFPQILNRENLDLMHFPYFSVPILYKRPFVITVHDLIINNFNTGKASTLPGPLYQLKRAGYKHVLAQAVKNAKKIIVPLEIVKKDVKKTFSVDDKKIVVTYEGVDRNLSFRTENLDPNITKYFLYVGNAYPHKNLDRFIEAYLAFRKESGKNVQLVFVGNNDYFYKNLHERVKEEHLQGIYFKHGIADSELAGLYRDAMALISPSLMEGFGLPPLEAMASSCPILLSDIPSFREVCGDVAFYFDPYSVADMKAKMEFVYNLDRDTREEHVSKGLARVKEFSWELMAEKTLEVYNHQITKSTNQLINKSTNQQMIIR